MHMQMQPKKKIDFHFIFIKSIFLLNFKKKKKKDF